MKWIKFIAKVALIGLFYAFLASIYEVLTEYDIPLWFTALSATITVFALYDEWPFSVASNNSPE